MCVVCVLEDYQLRTLRAIRDRLFTEDRMNGDLMRDYAQALDAIVHDIEDCIPKEKQ